MSPTNNCQISNAVSNNEISNNSLKQSLEQ